MTTLTNPIFAPAAARPADDIACAHCAQPVPRALVDPAATDQFCCPGCRAVYDTLHACGLDAYYRLRDAAQAPAHPVDTPTASFAEFDSPTFHDLYVRTHDNGTASCDLLLENVSCAACVWLLERLPRVLPGVLDARLSLRDSIVRVTWTPSALPLSSIARAIARFGYTPHPARSTTARQLHRRETRKRLVHLGVAGALMGNTMLLAFALYAGDAGHMTAEYRTLFRVLSALLGTLALAWPGATFFRSTYAALRTRSINLDVPITLALAVGGVAGLVNVLLGRGEIYFDSLSVLVFLLLVGRFIQYGQQRKADDAVGLLFSLTPSSCRIVTPDGSVLESPIESLSPGDTVEVLPGQLFPADGTVLAGRSAADQALLTGESAPVPVGPGSPVHAGSQNTASTLRVRVTSVGADTRVGKLMNLVERGVQDRPPILLFADRVGRWFTAAVSVAAVAVFAFWLPTAGLPRALDHTIALLIVTCPCVLGLATPMTLALAIGQLARRDVLVKSGAALEALSRPHSRLLLDKTGTLTEGRLQLLTWTGDPSLKPVVASLESRSIHPVARALHAALTDQSEPDQPPPDLSDLSESNGGIRARYQSHPLHVGSPTYTARHGITIPPHLAAEVARHEHDGLTTVLISLGGTAVALAALGDRLRPDSAPALARLRSLGYAPTILSGDAQPVVTRIATQLSLDPSDALGRLSPESKLHHVRTTPLAATPRVARPPTRPPLTPMVGDGINDAAALAAADVGIAVHGGAEASLAAADIYIARPGLAPLVELVTTSRRAMRTIRRNFLISLAYNLLAGTLAATGLMTPLVAAILMPLSSATVLTLAALSIRRHNNPQPQGAPWK